MRRNLLITAYSVDPRGAAIFRGGPDYAQRILTGDLDPDLEPVAQQLPIPDAVAGSAAAPTFFPPRLIRDPDQGRDVTVIDGAVYLNDPALAAYTDAISLFPDDEIRVVSFGTGRAVRAFPYERVKGWGFLEWLSPVGPFRTPLIGAMMDGQARAAHKQLRAILGLNYHRFDYDLTRGYGSDSLDDASRRNLERLELGAEQMAGDLRPHLRAVAEMLEDAAP